MCWDGTRGVAPCFGVAIFSRISQAFSEESSSWELPTVLSLADSYFHNSSFLWGDMKHGSRWTYSELPATVKIPGFQWATLFAKWYGQEDYRAAHLLKTRQEHNRGSPSAVRSAPRTVTRPLPRYPRVSSTGLSSLSLHPSQLGRCWHSATAQDRFSTLPPTCVPWLDPHLAGFSFGVEISDWYQRESVSPTSDTKDLGATDVFWTGERMGSVCSCINSLPINISLNLPIPVYPLNATSRPSHSLVSLSGFSVCP